MTDGQKQTNESQTRARGINKSCREEVPAQVAQRSGGRADSLGREMPSVLTGD